MTDKLIEEVAIAICKSDDNSVYPCECVGRTECADMLKAARAAIAAIEASGTHVVAPVALDADMIGQLVNYRTCEEWDYTDAWDSLLAARPKVLP